jgi:hypothetical protein
MDMRKASIWICALLMSIAALGQAADQASATGTGKKSHATHAAASKSPLVGTWRLQSSNDWKSATFTCTKDTDDAIEWRLHGVGNDGKPFHYSFAGKKGTEGKTTGAPSPETVTWNKDGSFQSKSPDGSSSDLKMAVSEDGKTMTVTGTGKDANGKTADVKDVWTKGGAKPSGAKKSAKSESNPS